MNANNMVLLIALFGTFLVMAAGPISGQDHGVISCSFGTDLCGWRHPVDRVYSWQRVKSAQSNGKPISSTSTSIDDYFLFASGGDAQLLEHKNLAVLHSVEFYNPAAGALRFWHVSESPSAPGLYVNVTQNGVATTVKSFRGFAHHWTERVISVAKPGRTVLTIACAPVGHGIDELEYTRDAEIAVFQEVVVPYQRPLVQDAEVSCSFHKTMCGWSAYPGLPGKWVVTNGKNLPRAFVHNSSNPWLDSSFLCVGEEKDYGEDSQAAIITHSIRQNTSSWLSLWWAKFEPGQGESAIFVKVITETATETVFYSKIPAHNWVSQNISIPYTGRLRILIGFRLKTQHSLGVLDEIQYSGDLQEGSTEEITTVGPEGSGYGDDNKEFLF